jgi:hypothetical protein
VGFGLSHVESSDSITSRSISWFVVWFKQLLYYNQTEERSPIDGGDEITRAFPLCAYRCIPLHLPEAYFNQPIRVVTWLSLKKFL